MPFLTFPLALLGLVALPAVVGIYFLRNRYKRKPVSSLFLWELHTRSQEGGPRVTNLQFPLLLLLELLILACLVLAATDPRWRVNSRLRPLVVVLDDSASMALSRDEARAVLKKETGSLDHERIRLIFAGASPRVAGPAVTGWEALNAQLKDWSCQAPTAELERALALAQDLGDKDTRILVISDQSPGVAVAEVGPLRWHAVGQARPNVGFVNAGRTSADSSERCYFEIGNYGTAAARTVLTVPGRADEDLMLDPGEVRRILFPTPAELQGKTVEARLSTDVLAADNQVSLVPAPPRPVEISIDCKDREISRMVRRGLAAAGHKTFGQVDPDLMITDHPVPSLGNNEIWVFEIFPEKDAQAFAGPFITRTEHPLMEGVDLLGSVWGAAASNQTTAVEMDPVIAIGNTALLAARPPRIRMHFKPSFSTLQDNPNWPILLYNLLTWRRTHLPGISEANLRIGSELEVRTALGVKTVEVTGPDGALNLVPRQRRARFVPSQTGVYEIVAGADRYQCAVNLLSPDESDLRGLKSGVWGKWMDTGVLRKEYRSTAWIWLLIALAAFVAHLWLVRRTRRPGFA